MAGVNKGIGRGKRLQLAAQHIKNSDINNLQNQLYMAGSNQYTNESIEKVYNNMVDGFYNECPGYSSNSQIPKKNILHQPLASSQFSDDDPDIQEIDNKTTLDMNSSRQSPNELNEAKRNDIPFESQVDAEDHSIGSNITYDLFHDNFEKTTHFQNSQIITSPSKLMGRGQMLKKVTAAISKPGGTLQNEINAVCGTEYTNQSIEKFVESLTREKDGSN